MSIESDAASQVVGIYTQGIALGAQVAIKVGEATFKLTGQALKELIEFIEKSIRQEGKSGRLLLTNMLTRAAKEEKTLSIIRINGTEDFDKLASELKSYGVTFSKARGKENYDILFFEEDAPRMNIILEKLGLNKVEKVSEAKAEQVDIKEDPLANVPDYEQELPFDDENITYYENAEDLLNELFDKKKERGDKEQEVPTKDRNNPEKNGNLPEKKSEKGRKNSISHKKSVKEVISDKKAERAGKAVESSAKAVDIPKNIKQGVKSK